MMRNGRRIRMLKQKQDQASARGRVLFFYPGRNVSAALTAVG